ncbi:MAG TPA: 5'/3'-nucleotidase SurE, partial [Alphaproteobacteria bacterium]|nr:5'/3'-nucleotidase SurE [Alphaproteobacteria bacterium]
MAIGENGRVGRILISNDDGIDAMGIEVLEAIAREIADEVWVVAPEGNCSGFGRSITLKREIRATRVGDNRYTCDGTPTDCVIYAVNHLMAETPPDLVLSGINLGMNISDDITCSGTIGAAWEAAV